MWYLYTIRRSVSVYLRLCIDWFKSGHLSQVAFYSGDTVTVVDLMTFYLVNVLIVVACMGHVLVVVVVYVTISM